MATNGQPIIEVNNLYKFFPVKEGIIRQTVKGNIHAVDNISFKVYKGETLGLVGESGCGKTTTARMLLRLTVPTEGTIWINGIEISKIKKRDMHEFRKSIQMVFQDPYSSLNPRMTVYDIISEGINLYNLAGSKSETEERVMELMDLVGLAPFHIYRYPHEFSGGQRQRIGIARSLSVSPDIIVADEPVSALDVSIRAQILNLLDDLQDELGLTYIIVAHDLSVIRHVSDRVAVMYVGKLVEIAETNELYAQPMHPYTEALMSAVPIPDPKIRDERKRILLHGDAATPFNPKPGCRFRERCAYAKKKCEEDPILEEKTPGHFVSCWFPK
ncbi:MAG: ABC transporter ATP-binding protein [Candidatus Hodarchaeales archaeon]